MCNLLDELGLHVVHNLGLLRMMLPHPAGSFIDGPLHFLNYPYHFLPGCFIIVLVVLEADVVNPIAVEVGFSTIPQLLESRAFN